MEQRKMHGIIHLPASGYSCSVSLSLSVSVVCRRIRLRKPRYVQPPVERLRHAPVLCYPNFITRPYHMYEHANTACPASYVGNEISSPWPGLEVRYTLSISGVAERLETMGKGLIAVSPFIISRQSISDDVTHVTQLKAPKNMSALAAAQTEPKQNCSLRTKSKRAMKPLR